MKNAAVRRSTVSSNARLVSRKPQKPALRLVNKSHPSSKRYSLYWGILLVAVFLGSLIVIPLLINTQLAVLSYEIHDDQVKLNKLQEENQNLRGKVTNQSSPERVRKIAEEAGLIPAGETGYITLSKNTVEGGVPAVPPPPEEPLPEPSKEDSAKLLPKEETKPQQTGATP